MADIDVFKAYELYLAERNRLTSSKHEASKAYDRTVLTFSAGAIVLSITFLEKIALTPIARELLFFSWIFFALAIASTMYSLLASQKAIEREIRSLDDRYKSLVGLRDEEIAAASSATQFGVSSRWLAHFHVLFSWEMPLRFAWFGTAVKWFNRFAGVFFFIGVILFSAFALKNWMSEELPMGKDFETTDGRNAQLPEGIGRTRGGEDPESGVLPPIKDATPPPTPPKEKE